MGSGVHVVWFRIDCTVKTIPPTLLHPSIFPFLHCAHSILKTDIGKMQADFSLLSERYHTPNVTGFSFSLHHTELKKINSAVLESRQKSSNHDSLVVMVVISNSTLRAVKQKQSSLERPRAKTPIPLRTLLL